MIQSPQLAYMPNQLPAVPMQPMQNANTNIQYPQQAGYYYNYPYTSCYAQPQNGKSQYNGVNIEIINPQGQGMPFAQMPQAAPMVQPYFPQQPYNAYQPAVPVQQPAAAVNVQPQSYAIPAAPMPAVPYEQPVQNIPAAPVQTPAPVINQPQPAIDTTLSPESFAGRLRNNDLQQQQAAIEEVAELVKNNQTMGSSLVDTVIIDALTDIIKKDTTNIEGPSAEVLELRAKQPEELTEQQRKLAETLSPLEQAEQNKQYALYTLAYIQERLNNELVNRSQPAVELENLPAINTVIEAVKDNKNPQVRSGAIAALAHISRPEYKDNLKTIFELAKEDEDEKVQGAATKALEAINA